MSHIIENVPFISQLIKYPTGCESVSTAMALNYWGCPITVEELIPAGSPQTAEPEDAFELKLITDVKTEVFYHCRFTSVKREHTRDGLRRIRTGISMLREEE